MLLFTLLLLHYVYILPAIPALYRTLLNLVRCYWVLLDCTVVK